MSSKRHGAVEFIVEDFSATTRLLGVWLLGNYKGELFGNLAFFISKHSIALFVAHLQSDLKSSSFNFFILLHAQEADIQRD